MSLRADLLPMLVNRPRSMKPTRSYAASSPRPASFVSGPPSKGNTKPIVQLVCELNGLTSVTIDILEATNW